MYFVTLRQILLEFLNVPENLLKILVFQYIFLLKCVHWIQPEFIITFRCEESQCSVNWYLPVKKKKKTQQRKLTQIYCYLKDCE